MKGVILYSSNDGSRAAALQMAAGLAIPQAAVYDAYDLGPGTFLKDALSVRAFPALVPVLDHLQGAGVTDITKANALIAEMTDIEDREMHGSPATQLSYRLQASRSQGVQDVKTVVASATDLAALKTQVSQMS